MLQVDYLILADAAQAVEGKHYILGAGWDRVSAMSFPFALQSLGVAIRLRIPWNDTNQPHTFEVDVLDDDGASILPAESRPIRGNINVGRPPQIAPGSDQVACLALNLSLLQFVRPGAYVVVVRVADREVARSPFSVASGVATAMGQRPPF